MTAEKIAVIGAGNWGRHLVRVFCELLGPGGVVCCDEDEEARNRAKRL